MTTATFTKLRSGEWGLRVPLAMRPAEGLAVSVAKKSGATSTETIGRVLWTGNGIALCTIATRHVRHRNARRECAECGEIIRKSNQRCWETGGICHPTAEA